MAGDFKPEDEATKRLKLEDAVAQSIARRHGGSGSNAKQLLRAAKKHLRWSKKINQERGR